jgi:hypothetical protein
MVFQEQNRAEIREHMLLALGGIKGVATGGASTSSLIALYSLQGGDDDHNRKMVYMTKTAGLTATDKTFISDYAGTTHTATLSPVVSGSIAAGDVFELYPYPFTVDDFNNTINRAILNSKVFVERVTDSNFTLANKLEYDWLTPYAFNLDFKGIYKVEHVYSAGVDHLLADCATAWTAGANVVATVDTAFSTMEGPSAKLVVAAGAAAGAVLGYLDISALDITDCDRIEFDMYSSINLTAGYLDFVLDDTAGCVSAVESIDIPAMTAGVKYRHSITMANPHLDSAIISLGVVNTTDVGACTLYFKNIHAVYSGSKEYRELNPKQWNLAGGSSPKLVLTSSGKGIVGNNKQIRISGYASPYLMTDDTTDCEINPEYVTEWALGYLMVNHAQASQLDILDRTKIGMQHLANAQDILKSMHGNFRPDTRFL